MPYQTFDDQVGDSNSSEKLRRLALPSDLTGRNFLDVGCNEGFFCMAARERGASKVVGIDADPRTIARAIERFPDVDFRVQSWAALPDGPFDIILLSSALHYESRPLILINNIHDILADDGLFILEAGAVPKITKDKLWIPVDRGQDTRLYPTLPLLIEDLLANFAVRIVGRSVNQSGDPVPRFVFHCRKFERVALVAPGPSGIGKTTLAIEFSRKAIERFSTDAVLEEMLQNNLITPNRVINFIRKNFVCSSINVLIKTLTDNGMADEFANLLFTMMPKESRMIFIEGFALNPPEIYEPFCRLLKMNKFRVWKVSPFIQ